MNPNNQKMFQLVKMIPRIIIKKVATFPPFTGDDLDRYTAVLDVLEPACDTYMEMLLNDEVQVSPSDVNDLRDLIRRLNQIAFFEFLDVLEEVRDYIKSKVDEALSGQPDEGGTREVVTEEVTTEEPEEEDVGEADSDDPE